MNKSKKNILITGGSGFIGSNFINYFLQNFDSFNIINIDNLTYAASDLNTKSFKKSPNYRFYKIDITNYDSLKTIFEQHEISGVINFAAESHVDNSIINPSKFVNTNIIGVHNLLKLCNHFWLTESSNKYNSSKNNRFHQVSTDEVYGSVLDGSSSEGDAYRPNSPYSASKAAADLLVRSYNITYGLNTTISISSNNYGLNQNEEKLIPKILKYINEKKIIPIYGNGKNIRDWIHVLDNCKAICSIFLNGTSGEVYNVGGKNELSNIHLLEEIEKILDMKLNYEYTEDRPGHDFRYSLDISKIQRELNWSPKISFKSGLKDLIKNKIK